MKFRIGQKVQCIGMEISYCDKLNIGQVYTISEFDNTSATWIRVKENNSCNSYHMDYFRPIVEWTDAQELV